VDRPEVRIARRLVERLALTPPVNIKSLVRSYADLSFRHIPEPGVDGICLNLKVPGKRPKVVVNSGNPTTRKRFTLAHELGHILIPWHLGSIIDNLDVPETPKRMGVALWYRHLAPRFDDILGRVRTTS